MGLIPDQVLYPKTNRVCGIGFEASTKRNYSILCHSSRPRFQLTAEIGSDLVYQNIDFGVFVQYRYVFERMVMPLSPPNRSV